MVCASPWQKMVKGDCGGKIITIGRGTTWCEIRKKKKTKENQTVDHGKRVTTTAWQISIHNGNQLVKGDSSIACIPGQKGSSTTRWTVSPLTPGRATVGSPDLKVSL
jgi:hypothetical protein